MTHHGQPIPRPNCPAASDQSRARPLRGRAVVSANLSRSTRSRLAEPSGAQSGSTLYVEGRVAWSSATARWPELCDSATRPSTPRPFLTRAPRNASVWKIATAGAATVFKSLIHGAHISFATNAGSAGTATTANHASHADNATNATNVDTATTAARAIASVSHTVDTSAGAVTVPACSGTQSTPDHVGATYAIATCPRGTMAIGGGGTADPGVELSGSFPTSEFGSCTPNAWEVDVDNHPSNHITRRRNA